MVTLCCGCSADVRLCAGLNERGHLVVLKLQEHTLERGAREDLPEIWERFPPLKQYLESEYGSGSEARLVSFKGALPAGSSRGISTIAPPPMPTCQTCHPRSLPRTDCLACGPGCRCRCLVTLNRILCPPPSPPLGARSKRQDRSCRCLQIWHSA